MPVARLTRAQGRIRAAGLSDVLRVTAAEVRQLSGADLVVVATQVEGRQELVSRETCGSPWPGGPALGDRLPMDGTLAGLAVTTASSLLCRDGADDPRSDPVRNTRFGIGSSLAVPIFRDGDGVRPTLTTCS